MTDSGVPRSTEGEPTPKDDPLARLRAMSREMDIGGGEPFSSRDEADEAAYTVMNCQGGDDDIMCISCHALTRRLLATARLAVEAQQDRERLREISDCLFSEAANLEDFGNEATVLTQRVLRASVQRLRAYATTLRFDAARSERPTGGTE
jgi:hypothetical protein